MSGGRALGLGQGWLLPGLPDVAGGRPLASQTPESEFPIAASTRRVGDVGGSGGGEGVLGGGVGGELRSVAAVGWDRQRTICQTDSRGPRG